MIVSARVSHELAAEIERVAAAHGQSKAAWMANVLARAALAPENDRLPTAAGGGGHPDDQVRVTIRLNRSEIEAIDAVGAPIGLSRNEWIKRALLIDSENMVMRYNLACALATYLGDLDGAIDLLVPYFASVEATLFQHAEVDPDMSPLRDLPRYQTLVAGARQRLGLAETALDGASVAK